MFKVRTNLDRKRFELQRMRATVVNVPDEAMKGYYARLRDIAWAAVREAREHIENDTQTKKYRETGEKGRRDTGKMIASFWANVGSNQGKRYRINVGYLAGDPSYAMFQEYGTSQGLVGVEALRVAKEYVAAEVGKLGNGRNFISRSADSWSGGDKPEWFKGYK